MARSFTQVDVFTAVPYRGNPLAVVLDGDGLPPQEMQRFTHWMNLSETTFVLPPTDPAADYRVRIFTPAQELPFAGHPTLGTCHAWLGAGGTPGRPGVIVQECGAGLVQLRQTADGLAFAAPPVLRDGPVDADLLAQVASALQLDQSAIVDASWADNGPGWIAVLLDSAEAVLAVKPGEIPDPELKIGVAGPCPAGSPAAFEVRAFFPKDGITVEDPVTASLAAWLLRTGRASAPYVASQGTALGRAGRVYISRDADGAIWVGGSTVTCISGQVDL